MSQPWFTLNAGTNVETLSGTYAIRFFDVFDRDYVTAPLDAAAGTAYAAELSAGAGSACAHVVSALEALPNTVVPAGTVVCSSDIDETAASYATYALTFTATPAACGRSDRAVPRRRDAADDARERGAATRTASAAASFRRHRARSPSLMTLRPPLARSAPPTPQRRVRRPLPAAVRRRRRALSRGGDTARATWRRRLGRDAALKRCLGDGDGNSANDVDEYDWDHATSRVRAART